MSFITKEIKAAASAFRNFLMPVAMQRNALPNANRRVYRYPAPGSEPANSEFNYIDYKTAYRDSIHHIRNDVDTHKTMQGYVYIEDPIGETAAEKLVRFGFLKKAQINDTSAVESARAEYEKEVGESVDVRVHHDDLGFSEQPITKGNVESVSEYVTGLFEGVRQFNASESYLNSVDDLYNAEFYILKTFDVAADDPVYRQLTIDMQEHLEEIAASREELKKFPIFKSNPATWAILDDSFSAENIRKVQASVRNFTGFDDLTPVHYGEGEIPVPKVQPTIDIPSKSRYVE